MLLASMLYRQRVLVTALLVSIPLLETGFRVPTASAQGQNNSPRTSPNSQLLDGLFRDILSTQMERTRQRDEARNQSTGYAPASPFDVGSPRGVPESGVFSRPPSTLPTSVPRERDLSRGYYPDSGSLRSLQAAMDGFAQQMGYLRSLLQARANTVLGLRPLLTDVMRIKASADNLSALGHTATSYSDIYRDYLDLDMHWRNLSYQLRDLNGLDSATQRTVRQLDAYSDQIVDLFRVEPQFDRQGMLDQMTMARSYLTTLLDDVRYEIPRTPQRDAVINEGLRLQEQIRREGDFVRTARYDEIVPRYTEFVGSWRRFSGKLLSYKNARLNRNISQIRKCGEAVYHLLWIPASLDRNYLAVMASSYNEEIQQWLVDIPLASVARLNPSQQQQALAASKELDQLTRQFHEAVRSQTLIVSLAEQFRGVRRSRDRLQNVLGPDDTNEGDNRRLRIDAYDGELRDLLDVPEALDLSQAMQLASAIEGLADTFKQDVHRYGPYYQNGTFRNQAYQVVDTFFRQAQQMNSAVASGVPLDQLQTYGNSMLTTWNSVMRMVAATSNNGLDTSRFQRLDRTRQDLAPLIAELATMLTI